jgi:hypothetical protein
MMSFTYRLKVRESVKAKCPRHPRYNPERGGYGAIVGGCSTCREIYLLFEARTKLDVALREFHRRAVPWQRLSRTRTITSPETTI